MNKLELTMIRGFSRSYSMRIGLFVGYLMMKTAVAQDFQVSTLGTAEFSPHLASDSVGNFVIVWTDYRNAKGIYGGSGSDGDIYGQRFDHKGIAIEGNFRISDDSLGTNISFGAQAYPRVAMNSRGEFVVTWVDNRPKGTPPDPKDPYDFNIYAQRFDNHGNRIERNFLVNDDTSGAQLNPDIVIKDDGSFVVVWENVADGKCTYLQAFDSAGQKMGQNQRLDLIGEQPRIALLEDGSFVVAAGNAAQIFSSYSNRIGELFAISMGYSSEIRVGQGNRIFIAYSEQHITSEQFLDSDIYLRVYDTLGHSIFGPLKVNDDNTDYWQTSPSLSLSGSHIFVAWEDNRNAYERSIGSCRDIYGQRFDTNLSRIGSNFKVTHESNNSAQLNVTSVMRHDTLYVAWLDARRNEFYPIYPPSSKKDTWATVQDFDNPMEGTPIPCTSSPTPVPTAFKFFQNYPNPTRSESIFTYDLPEDADVRLSLYDVLGREVKILLKEYQTAGRYVRGFTNDDLPSGTYFAKFDAKMSSGILVSSISKIIFLK